MNRDTKAALLDAAEHLFGEAGVDATSVRDIAQRAGVNLAAANYHFGGKEQLVHAVFQRRFEPMTRQRLALLDAVEAAAGPRQPLPVEAVIDAFLRPIVEGYTPLLGRLFSENRERAKSLFKEIAREAVQRFDRAFARACPHLGFAERHWAMHFAAGSAILSLMGAHILEAHSGGRCNPKDTAGLLRRLIAHHAPAFQARPVRKGARG